MQNPGNQGTSPVDCTRELSKFKAWPAMHVFAHKPIWQRIKWYLGLNPGDNEKEKLGYTQDDLLMRLGALRQIYNRINAGIVKFSKNPNWFKDELKLSQLQQELARQYIRFDELFDKREDDKVRDAILQNKWIYGPNPLLVCAIAMQRVSFINWAQSNGFAGYQKVAIV